MTDLGGMLDGLDGRVGAARCSRADCGESAEWNVNWRNPRIHGLERVKVWLACDEHRDYLYDYLSTRDFPVIVTALGAGVEVVPDAAADPGPDRVASDIRP